MRSPAASDWEELYCLAVSSCLYLFPQRIYWALSKCQGHARCWRNNAPLGPGTWDLGPGSGLEKHGTRSWAQLLLWEHLAIVVWNLLSRGLDTLLHSKESLLHGAWVWEARMSVERSDWGWRQSRNKVGKWINPNMLRKKRLSCVWGLAVDGGERTRGELAVWLQHTGGSWALH